MNTTEHLVEVYYRQLGCFSATDTKIVKGNNRQFDILAFHFTTKKFYHIEVNVAHGDGVHWKAATLDNIKEKIRYKFFGSTRNSRPGNKKTDFAKGKHYLDQIKATYTKFGIDYNEVIRVWCTWCLPNKEVSLDKWKKELAEEFNLQPDNFQLLLFRDTVLPTLLDNIGTAYYDDELLRTLSLIKEYNRQTATAPIKK
jgi:hypothetical protein